ncbi:DUF4062 domain-containing protein [Burkholderia contaminans]|uniref:DUF4062 domain-containing protein n=1 Tax=Burkholderia contaminans TaxID=488447 RepID=UPI001454722E|nr:DUF4062 domain-containing protein [Burkholderia contaminans]MCA8150671.1 DUF4062 domain-containing protein [Burkholderia contaminans]VWC76807.1 hypothetical protein BCO19218_00946 [Burkholderia contaminans]
MDKKYQVFISSTYLDMKEERQTAVMSILSAGHIPAGMELFAASDEQQMEVIRRWIDESDIFMLILGGRYGSVDPRSGKSYIQLEYEYAVEAKKPLFALYLTDEMLDEKVRKHGREVIEQNDTRAYKDFHSLVTSKLCAQVVHVKDISIEVPKAIADLTKKYKLDGWVRASSVATAAPTTLAEPKIEFTTGLGAPYHVTELQSGHMLSTVRIGVKNTGGKPFSNCKVYVEQISPPPDLPGAERKLLEHAAFRLRNDEAEEIVDIAAHWDHINRFRFCAPLPGGAFGDPYDLNDIGPRTFVIRAVAAECERSANFELRMDEAFRLHLTFLSYID